jgi:hypothetical protein
MTTPVECVILDIPDGLRLDLLGLVVGKYSVIP